MRSIVVNRMAKVRVERNWRHEYHDLKDRFKEFSISFADEHDLIMKKHPHRCDTYYFYTTVRYKKKVGIINKHTVDAVKPGRKVAILYLNFCDNVKMFVYDPNYEQIAKDHLEFLAKELHKGLTLTTDGFVVEKCY